MTGLTEMVDKPNCGFPFGENLFGQALKYPKTARAMKNRDLPLVFVGNSELICETTCCR